MRKLVVLTTVALACLAVRSSGAQETRFESMARRAVRDSGRVKPGEVVVIAGGKHVLPLMEALAIEAQKAGALTQILVSSDRVVRSSLTEVPDEYFGQKPTYLAEWFKQVDVYIGLPGTEDPKTVFAGVAPERLARNVQAGRVITDMLDASGMRAVFIGYPTKEVATLNKVDFPAFEKMHWEAVDADARAIVEKGKALRTMLQGSKVVRVTTPSGTNLTFSVGNRTIFVDDGTIGDDKLKAAQILTRSATLPGGLVYVAPIETSANGKVVVPRHRCRNEPMTGVSFDFASGKLQNFRAEANGECFSKVLAPYFGPKDMFGYFQIGLNPARKVMESPGDYRPGDAAGMVGIAIGDNKLNGGNNTSAGGFFFPIVNATVEIDGKVVVKDGRLVP